MSDKVDLRLGSNEIRLSPREWLIALVIIGAFLGLTPLVWKAVEPLRIEPNHRIPYALSADYWIYSRLCRAACDQGKVPIVGDSVVWGHFVAKDQTLSAHLNRLGGEERFANLGVDGIRPAAMEGLVQYHAQAISGRSVLLHSNLLWMSDARADLQDRKEVALNHPTLVPQFSPNIPSYRETYSNRLGIAIERRIPFHAWKKHMQIAYFQSQDLPTWTGEHPYENPLRAITLEPPSASDPPPDANAGSWRQRGLAPSNPPWVELETSIQWLCFRRTIATLQSRGNRVFVLVGPFNEHMLMPESLELYKRVKMEIEAWLQEENIPYLIPPALPSELYADSSHPLAEGYALLAKRLSENDAFARFTHPEKGNTK